MLTGKWTPMNQEVARFNSMFDETMAMSGENDEDWMTRVKILYKTHTRVDFKHKSAWLFLKDKHKWKNPDSTMARRSRGRITDEEPEHFGEDAFPRPPDPQRIAKSQRSSNSTASFGSNPTMFQEMMQQQYELDRKAKMNVINERQTRELRYMILKRLKLLMLQLKNSKQVPQMFEAWKLRKELIMHGTGGNK
ncbi:hypothetical protein Tco_0633733 [Tanacetum coccineum]